MGTTRKISRAGRGAKHKMGTSKRGVVQPRPAGAKVHEGPESGKNPQRTARLAGGLRASRNAGATKGGAR